MQPLGTATLDSTRTPPAITFPVTGGTSTTTGSTTAATINHQGSGVAITNHSNYLFLTNFVIDSQKAVMSGDTQTLDVFGRNYGSAGSATDLFTLQPTGTGGQTFRLLFNGTSSAALNTVSGKSGTGTTNWTGTEFGIAHLNFQTGGSNGGGSGGGSGGGPNSVPEPGTAVLLTIGLAGVLLRAGLKRG